MKPFLLLVPAFCLIGLVEIRAAAITLDASRDNTIYSESFAQLSNGQGPFLYAGRNAQDNLRRTLLRFDLNAIPAGSTITGAKLILSMDRTISGAFDFSLHRLLATWGEGASNAGTPGGNGTAAQTGDATWTLALFPGTAWSTSGGTFASTASATTSVGAIGSYEWASAQVISDIQNWVNDPTMNFGWLLKGGESALSAKRFVSAEGLPGAGPSLVITYEPGSIPEPASVALLSATGAAVLARRRRSVRR